MAEWSIGRFWRWAKELKRGRPGRRFQDHYSRRHDVHGGERSKPAFIWGGVALIVAGFVFSFWPLVPGSLMMLLGAGAIATKSKTAAKGFDWAEAKVRERIRRVRSWRWVVKITTQPSIESSLPPGRVAAWITLGALLLSLVCAVVGALAGRRDPDIVPAR